MLGVILKLILPALLTVGLSVIFYMLKRKIGDKFCLYTDGVTEATDKNNQLYGKERQITYLNK